MWKNLRRQVSRYPAEMIWLAIKTGILFGFYAWFFYRSLWALIPLSVVGIWQWKNAGCRLEKQKVRELEQQFQECILSVAAALRAGYSVENAFLESIRDMRIMFGKRSVIVCELEGIRRGMQNNRTLEQQLIILSAKSGSPFIREFAEILSIAKRSGGNLTVVISDTAEAMNEQARTCREIEDVVSGRRFEGKIMSVIPFALIIYIQLGNPGYFDGLYHNPPGVVIMTGCLAAYLVSVHQIERVMEKIVL